VDGWCVIERALAPDDLAAAQNALARLFPTADGMADPANAGDRARWGTTWDAAWPEFPFLSRTLSRLVVGDLLVGLATTLLGTRDVRMYLAMATAKYAGQPSDYNRLLHADFPNQTLTVPRAEDGYQQMETFVYLNDVDSGNGATHFLPRRYTRDVPVEEHTLNLQDHGALYDLDVEAAAPAGSVVVYRPDVYHRSVDFDDPTRARFMLHVSYRPASMEWGGYQAWPIKGFSPEWHRFVADASPRQLEVLGFPPPGHLFWTADTLAGVGRRYPGLDLTPWAEAMASGG
jgi:hypothetical protein